MAQPLFPSLSLGDACNALRQGRVLIFPTETYFGLGCDAMNADAVGQVFSIKKRSLDMPLPVVCASPDAVSRIVAHVPPLAQALMDRFWPGPLSIVLPARPDVPDLLTANAGRIAVRLSPHPAVRLLCESTGMILVASSANISGHPSVTVADQLEPELAPGVAGIFNMEPEPSGGLPSTVVDVSMGRGPGWVRILRQGGITAEDMTGAGFSVRKPEAEE